MLYYSYPQIVLQEVPDEISLALSISGCSLNCKGCHSKETFSKTFGNPLTEDELNSLIKKHKHISCVLFYGGEWESDYLLKLLKIVNKKSLKTCLYTGEELFSIAPFILQELDYIKTGPYIESLGGLGSETTNQKFYKLINGIPTDTNKL